LYSHLPVDDPDFNRKRLHAAQAAASSMYPKVPYSLWARVIPRIYHQAQEWEQMNSPSASADAKVSTISMAW
jgi:hypothetical protein